MESDVDMDLVTVRAVEESGNVVDGSMTVAATTGTTLHTSESQCSSASSLVVFLLSCVAHFEQGDRDNASALP